VQEILVATAAVRNLIREGKPHQIESVIQSGGQFGMQSLNQALGELIRARKVTADAAVAASNDPAELRTLLGML
jgi:twitching motility protein PilT